MKKGSAVLHSGKARSCVRNSHHNPRSVMQNSIRLFVIYSILLKCNVLFFEYYKINIHKMPVQQLFTESDTLGMVPRHIRRDSAVQH